ncbi:MAG: hypothetical protein OXG64_06875 [Chloroflexi bacterium]|nr:hypothetical protein [Chloroflexota bacterium]
MSPSLPRRPAAHCVIAAALLVAALAGSVGRAVAAPPPDATPVTGGAFFERSDGDGVGFAIRNYAEGPAFYSAYLRFGGAQTLGPPVSRPWIGDGGFAFQLTQRALLQWSPTDGRVGTANLFELLNRPEFAAELRARHIPAVESPPPLPPQLAQQARLAWMTDRAIAEAFANNPLQLGNQDASIEFHGLPMSRPVRLGPFIVQRFQRTALQYWVEQVDGGQPVGSVVLVNAGDIYRDLALPHERLAAPQAPDHAAVLDLRLEPPGETDLVPAPVASRAYNTASHRLRTALALLESVDVNATALELAESARLAIDFEPMAEGLLATFHAARGIRINESLSTEDPLPLAAVLAHELRHFEDFKLGRLGQNTQDCLNAEARALAREAETWNALRAADDRALRETLLVRVETSRATVFAEGPEAIVALAQRLYHEVCRQPASPVAAA